MSLEEFYNYLSTVRLPPGDPYDNLSFYFGGNLWIKLNGNKKISWREIIRIFENEFGPMGNFVFTANERGHGYKPFSPGTTIDQLSEATINVEIDETKPAGSYLSDLPEFKGASAPVVSHKSPLELRVDEILGRESGTRQVPRPMSSPVVSLPYDESLSLSEGMFRNMEEKKREERKIMLILQYFKDLLSS